MAPVSEEGSEIRRDESMGATERGRETGGDCGVGCLEADLDETRRDAIRAALRDMAKRPQVGGRIARTVGDIASALRARACGATGNRGANGDA